MEETPQSVADNLCNTYITQSSMTVRESLEWALFTANQVLSAMPNYGKLNEEHEFWKQVSIIICDKISAHKETTELHTTPQA